MTQNMTQLEKRIIDLENNLMDLDFMIRDHNKHIQSIIADLAQIHIKQIEILQQQLDFAKQIKQIQDSQK